VKVQIKVKERARIGEWDCMQLKRFCTAKKTITRFKKKLTEWEKIFASYSMNKRLISRIYQNSKNYIPK
jgi:DNA replication protein DnaC